MATKPFIGLHADCPDLSDKLPDMAALPALVGIVGDVDIQPSIPVKRVLKPWTPWTEDGCLPVKVQPGDVRMCDGYMITVLPGTSDACDGHVIDIYAKSRFWVTADVNNGLAWWNDDEFEFPTARPGGRRRNIPVLKVGQPRRLYRFTPAMTDGLKIESDDVKLVVRVDADPPCPTETDTETGIEYRVVSVTTADSLAARMITLETVINAYEDVTAVVDPVIDQLTGAVTMSMLVITTGNTFPATAETFSLSNPAHEKLLIASVVQLEDSAVAGYGPGDCDDTGKPGTPGPGSEDCCTITVEAIPVVDCDGSTIVTIKPPYDSVDDPEYCGLVDICDDSHFWLAIDQSTLEVTWEEGNFFPLSAPHSRIVPILRCVRTDRFREITYTVDSAKPTWAAFEAAATSDYPTPPGCEPGDAENPVLGYHTSNATRTDMYKALADRLDKLPGVTAMLFPDEDRPDNAGVIVLSTYKSKELTFGTGVGFIGSEQHCAVLHKSIEQLIDEPVMGVSPENCGPRKPWRPYDIRVSGTAATAKINGGKITWPDGTFTQVAPLSLPASGFSALSLPGDVTLGTANNIIYLQINRATRAVAWLQTDECLPLVAGDVLNLRIMRLGLSSEIATLSREENYEPGDTVDVAGITYAFIGPLNPASALAPDEIPVGVGSSAEESLGILASRINNTHPTVSALVVTEEDTSGPEPVEKTYLIATTVVADEDLVGITGTDASAEAKAALLALAFKYDTDFDVLPGTPNTSRRAQFAPRVISASAMTIAIGPGDVSRPGEEDTITADTLDAARFNEVETISPTVSKFWLQAKIYPAATDLALSIVCERGNEFPVYRTSETDPATGIYNNIPVAEAVRTASVAKLAYEEVDEFGEPVPYPAGGITIDGVTYTFVEGSVTADNQVPIGASKSVTYGTLAYMISRSDSDLHAGNFPDCDGKSGYLLVASYSRAAIPDTTAGAYDSADEQHKAFVMSSVRGLLGSDRVAVCDSDDVDLRSFRILYLNATTGYRLPGSAHSLSQGGSVSGTLNGGIWTYLTGEWYLRVAGVGGTDPLVLSIVDTPVQSAGVVSLPLYDCSVAKHGGIRYQQSGDVHLYSGGLPTPDPDTQDWLLMWDASAVSPNPKVRWFNAGGSGSGGLVYFKKDGTLDVLPSVGADFQVLQVYDGEWKIDNARIR